VLFSDSAFAGVGVTTNDIEDTDQAIRMRWVIDRLCTAAGAADPTRCTLANDPVPTGASGSDIINAIDATSGGAGALQRRVIYRVSIRVTGPRSTQAFFQTTLTL